MPNARARTEGVTADRASLRARHFRLEVGRTTLNSPEQTGRKIGFLLLTILIRNNIYDSAQR
jgi:hypothetical protein